LVGCVFAVKAADHHAMFDDYGTHPSFGPMIFTADDIPLIVEAGAARSSPKLTVLAAILHGHEAEIETAFPALTAAMLAADPRESERHYDVLPADFPPAVSTRWEAFVTTSADYEFRSELLRKVAARSEARGEERGEARGEARGTALAILTVLDKRGVAVPNKVHDQILNCFDTDQVRIWLERASIATTLAEVIQE
jgi:hypothetical protein